MKLRVVLISIIITVLLCSCNNAGHTNKTNIESINVQDKLIVANNIEIEGRKYESILYCFEGKEIRVLSLTTKESTLIIPSRINGYPVTKIGGDYNNVAA